MEITVEISYYPLDKEFEQPVLDYINSLQKESKVKVEPGHMSTIIAGDYDDVMKLLTESIRPFMEKMPSVFAMRITNACKTCKR
jgi:uncharacterized protein YqgV (UPF0045/DUF77 family)